MPDISPCLAPVWPLAGRILFHQARQKAGLQTWELAAPCLDDLHALVVAFARLMGDSERIAAIRLDEAACRAELDFGPVVPSRLH